MIHIQPPKLIYTPDDAEYVTTYVLDEEGNPTDQLANYEKLEDGFFVISDKLIDGLAQYAGKGSWAHLAGVKTYCYQWPDKAAYELDFPPEPVEEMPEPLPVEPKPYDLDAGKGLAYSALKTYCNSMYKALIAEYPEYETTTWDKQRLEALGEQPATIIEGSLIEGETVSELKATVLANSTAYSEQVGKIIKLRRETSRLIDAASKEQDITNILEGLL